MTSETGRNQENLVLQIQEKKIDCKIKGEKLMKLTCSSLPQTSMLYIELYLGFCMPFMYQNHCGRKLKMMRQKLRKKY